MRQIPREAQKCIVEAQGVTRPEGRTWAHSKEEVREEMSIPPLGHAKKKKDKSKTDMKPRDMISQDGS